jgi:hypothetical protein
MHRPTCSFHRMTDSDADMYEIYLIEVSECEQITEKSVYNNIYRFDCCLTVY